MLGSVRRHLPTVAAALVTAAVVATPPVAAHVTPKVKHTWKHLRPLVLNEVTWSNLKGIPAGFADGVDDTGGGGPATAWELDGNALTGTEFLGSTNNQVLRFRVNNVEAFRLEPTTGTSNIVGGLSANTVSPLAVGATISGGGSTGVANVVTDDFGTVGGGVDNRAGNDAGLTTDRPHATVGGGISNVAGGSQATVGGGSLNSAGGESATVGGGTSNSAAGVEATVGGGESNLAGGIDATVAGGNSNIASIIGATVGGGLGNTASGTAATISGGNSNVAGGAASSIPGGQNATAQLAGQVAHANGAFASNGDAQTSEFVLRRQTTDATPADLFLDGSSAPLQVFTGRRLSFETLVVGGTAGGDTAGYLVTGLIENIAGATSFVGTPTVTVLGEDVASWDVTVVADNTADALAVQVTGAASTTIRWVARVQTAELHFA